MRPRDLIQLCNMCRDGTSYRGGEKIAIEDITDVIPQYSRWKLEDLITEYNTY